MTARRFFEWICGLVELKAKCPVELWLPSALLGAAELIASGVGFVSDNTDAGVSVEALARVGLRGRVYQEVFGVEPEPDDAAVLRALTAKLEAHRQTLQALQGVRAYLFGRCSARDLHGAR